MAVKTEVVFMTPRLAGELLQHPSKNRTLRKAIAERYADIIAKDGWDLNGESIKVSEDGELLDGQHRLTACVKSGKGFKTVLVTGLASETFATIDRGRSRTIGDVLHIQGEMNCTNLAAVLRLLWCYEHNKMTNMHTSECRDQQVREVLDQHPSVRDHVSWAAGDAVKDIMSASSAAFCRYMFCRIDREAGENFMGRLVHGNDIKVTEPLFVLRRRLQHNVKIKALRTHEIVAIVIKAWNAARFGDSKKKTPVVSVWKEGEEFPKILA